MWGMGRGSGWDWGWKLWPLKKLADKSATKPAAGSRKLSRPTRPAANPGVHGELVFIPSLRNTAVPPPQDASHPAPLGRAPVIVPVRQLDLIGRLQRADDDSEVMQPAPQSRQEQEQSKKSFTLSSVRAPRMKRAKPVKKDGRAPYKGRESA